MFTYSGTVRKRTWHRSPFKPSRVLTRCPQRRGKVFKVRISTPRKPNSARRKTVKVRLSNKKNPVSYVPGGSHTLKKFSAVMVRGRGARDLPGVYSSCMRGKFDLQPPYDRRSRRSIYGLKSSDVGVESIDE